jgi:hypothetical protein
MLAISGSKNLIYLTLSETMNACSRHLLQFPKCQVKESSEKKLQPFSPHCLCFQKGRLTPFITAKLHAICLTSFVRNP